MRRICVLLGVGFLMLAFSAVPAVSLDLEGGSQNNEAELDKKAMEAMQRYNESVTRRYGTRDAQDFIEYLEGQAADRAYLMEQRMLREQSEEDGLILRRLPQ